MSSIIKLGLTATTLEISAVALLLQGKSPVFLVGFFVLHGLASVLMTPAIWLFLPKHYKQPARWIMLLLFSLCFFIPVLGALGFLIALLIAVWLPAMTAHYDFSNIHLPVYQALNDDGKTSELKLGHTPTLLKNSEAPLELRMKALIAIQDKPTHFTSHLLRKTLGDSSDDLRLLAYGILASKEKMITQQIHDARERLEHFHIDGNAHRAYNAARELAELYWELAYQHLVQGGMLLFLLQQVQDYTAKALKWNPADAGLYILSGRAHLQVGAFDQAEKAFTTALSLGSPPILVHPYLAELAFLQQDYAAVRKWMQHTHQENRMPRLHQNLTYWV